MILKFFSDLSWLKNKLRMKQLRQESLQPSSELILILDNPAHQVSFLQARGQEVVTTGLVIDWTQPWIICISF